MRTISKHTLCTAVAASLVDFGYSGVTADMIDTCLTNWLAGKRGMEVGHGVIGMFAERQFQELADKGADLGKLT